MKQSLCLLILCFGSAVSAEDRPWKLLSAPDQFDAWQKATNWQIAAEAEAKANTRELVVKEGKGIYVSLGQGNNLLTREKFGDIELHMEFMIPKGSNSGVKFMGLYEIQILDSHGKKEVSGNDCGGIYPRAEGKPKYHHIDKGVPPKVNACKAPGEWQTLDAIFLAPRFDKDGKKITNAKIVRATLNDQVIHENQELATPTGQNYVKPEIPTGPLLLQGDHGPVAFRNVKVREYTKK
jgi:hypothetical protein